MARLKTQTFSRIKAVKANARACVGTPPPQRVLPDPRQKRATKPRFKETLADLLPLTAPIRRLPLIALSASQLRSTVGGVLVAALATPLLLNGFAVPTLAQSIQVNKENRTISITATERVSTMADVAVVHVGFIVYGRDKDSAYNAGTQTSGAIIKALGGAGISADAIESDNQALAPVQNFQVERLSPAELANRRFQVQQSWLVRTTPADVAHVLDIAVLAGANQSGQIDWALKDENAAGADAAARALQRARSVASQMAQGLNARLGELLYASNESESSTVRPVLMMAMHKAADASEPLAINPRRIEKTATVRAIFAIESASAP